MSSLPVSLYKKPDDDLLQNYGASAKPHTLTVRNILRVQAQREATLLPIALSPQNLTAPLPFPAQPASIANTLQKMTWKPPELSLPSHNFLNAVGASERKAADEATFLTEIGKTAKLWAEAFPSTATLVDKVVNLGPWAAAAGAISFGVPVLVVAGLRLAVAGAVLGAISTTPVMIMVSVLDEACLKAQALKSTGEETVLYFLPQRDHNTISHFLFAHSGIRDIAEGKKLVMERVDDPEKIKAIIENHCNISDVVFSFHGNQSQMSLDRETWTPLGPRDAYDWPKNHFAPNARIILHACLTGDGPDSLAASLQNLLGDQFSVIAPTTAINALGMRVQDGEVSFKDRWGKDVTARFPRDNMPNLSGLRHDRLF